jgi:hypothetical protein
MEESFYANICLAASMAEAKGEGSNKGKCG